ncbi:MAG TPA: hypothetical protein DEA08_10810 [Planctomycetes bacterium]|nr:hypothetical protein [Planctomycetota bacterium]
MNITKISFSGSNPSMGPHNVKSTNTLHMGDYPDELERLLDDTRVNGQVSLRDYLQLRLAEDARELERIHGAYSPGRLAEGERILSLNVHFEGGPKVTLDDLRYFSLEGAGYAAFDQLIRERGEVSTFDPSDLFARKKKVAPKFDERAASAVPGDDPLD